MSESIKFNITGMTCDHCVRAITAAVKDVDGVADVQVVLDTNSAVVTGEKVDPGKVIEAIVEEGYEAVVA